MPKKEGTVQFLLSFADALRALGESVSIFLPNDVCDDVGDIEHYDLICLKDTLPFFESKVRKLAAEIKELNSESVVFTDEGRGSLAVLEELSKQGVNTTLVVHDPTPHPSRVTGGMRGRLSRKAYNSQWKRVFGMASKYVLLSKSSESKFGEIHPELISRLTVMPLCPHPPVECVAERPVDLGDAAIADSFYLFFGRIDEYKGLGRLLRAYDECSKSYPLVIAGSGTLSVEESSLLGKASGVVVLNRFISDGEMIWLFEHCLCVCLPYIEASQSGVLAMAYQYGKPVIVSDLDGLTEFVDEEESGLIFHTTEELTIELDEIAVPEIARKLETGARNYLTENLDWEKNIRRWLDGERGHRKTR